MKLGRTRIILSMVAENIWLIDKPSGWTSHDVVNWVRRQTGEKRVGHAGTLDPLATGLLIVLVGREATKRQSEFLHQDKEYDCTAELGVTTDTYDREGQELTRVPWSALQKITQADLEKILQAFTGEVSQQVPAFSAVKVKGQKLYDKARRGEVNLAELPVRTVNILSLKLTDFHRDEATQKTWFSITVHCSSGTYIRSLIHDLGQRLGVGATVTALRRTKIGERSVADAQALELPAKKTVE